MKNLQKRATDCFDSQLHRALRIRAAETGQPISKVINNAVRLSLAEDAEDLEAFERRAREPNLSFEAVLKDVKKRGKLREAGIARALGLGLKVEFVPEKSSKSRQAHVSA